MSLPFYTNSLQLGQDFVFRTVPGVGNSYLYCIVYRELFLISATNTFREAFHLPSDMRRNNEKVVWENISHEQQDGLTMGIS